jgi:hypothetical protein
VQGSRLSIAVVKAESIFGIFRLIAANSFARESLVIWGILEAS